MHQKIADGILVNRYIRGDKNALGVLIKRYDRRIYGFIFSKVKNKEVTDDLYQDTIIKVVEVLKKGQYIEQGRFISWIMRIAHNIIIDYFRKNKRMLFYENNDDFNILSVLEDLSPNIEERIIQRQLSDELLKFVNELDHDQKEVLTMRIYGRMTYREISEETGVGINTALGRMRYAILNLRKRIDKETWL